MNDKANKSRRMNHGIAGFLLVMLSTTSCAPNLHLREAHTSMPSSFGSGLDTSATAVDWRSYYADPLLAGFIDTALHNNQELNVVAQEIIDAQSDVRARKGEYLPFVDVGAVAGAEKVGRYTRNGAVEHTLEIAPGEEFPEPLQDWGLGLNMSWELDIWKKLRNAKKAAMMNYFSTVEGRNFLVTKLVAEVADTYYELVAQDNQLEILLANQAILEDALGIIRLQKQAGVLNELAVRRFEAEVLGNQSRQYQVRQMRVEAENHFNYLLGRFPMPVERNSSGFMEVELDTLLPGSPTRLLDNRPDIRQAQMDLERAKLDVKVAKANFYPALHLTGGVGVNAFRPSELLVTPASLIYSAAGDLLAPLVNRNGIKANYIGASARQQEAVLVFEQRVLNAVVEVDNHLASMSNMRSSYDLKKREAGILIDAVGLSTKLFRSARADYMEVLLTQRDALEARMELVESKKRLLQAKLGLYQALGGGWR